MNARRFHVVAGLTLLAVVAMAGGVNADDAIRFQRVMAPADRIRDWPVDGERYLPMDASEFDRWITALSPDRIRTPSPPGAVIVAADYEARLVGEQLRGQATADVRLIGSKPARLSFDPCNLAFGRAVWDSFDSKKSERSPQPALLGLTGQGTIEAVVPQSGRLRFDWSLAGRRDSSDVLVFAFELPGAAARTLSLVLPKQFTPSVSEGVVVGSRAVGKNQKMTRWQIELGGCRQFRLRLLPLGAMKRRPQLALLRESRTYDFTPRGLEVSAQWRLQAYNAPLQQLTVLLDPGLELTAARYGDAPLSWSAVRLADGGVKIVLTLSEPIDDVERVIRLTAAGRSTYDRPWRLPRIRTEGLVWQEGSLALTAVEPLMVHHITPIGCAQTGAGSLSYPRVGESFQFQAFDPDATVDVTLSHHPTVLQAVSATAMRLGDEETVARMTADFRTTEASRFSLEADLARRWRIDAVRSQPSGAVADWGLERRDDGSQRLRIRLSEPLSSDKLLRLKITARRLFAPRLEQLAGDDLPPLRFFGVTEAKRWVAVRAEGDNVLRLSGDDRLKRKKLEELSPIERELFAEPPGELLFEADDVDESLKLALVGEKPHYDAILGVDVAVGATAIRETCRIRCTVASGRVDRMPVLFFPSREGAVQWSLDGDATDRAVAARRWSDAERAAAGWDASLEVWELSFAKPQHGTFELTARRQVPWNGRQPVDVLLAALPEAAHEQGALELSSLDATRLNVDNRRLAPRLPSVATGDRSSSARFAYRYDPLRDTIDGANAAVRVLDSRESGSAEAWIWECRLESWFPQCGVARHRAAYDLQNAGRKSICLAMPAGITADNLRRVSIDGSPAAWRWTEGRLHVALPAGSKFLNLIVHWTTRAQPLGWVNSRSPAMPMPDVPVLRSRWTAWIPPGYENIQWSQTPASPSDANGKDANLRGWTAWRFDLSPDAPVTLHFMRTDSMWLWSAVALLAAAALSGWKGVARPGLWILLLLGFSTAVLILPDAYATIALGGLLGTLLGMVWRWVDRRRGAAVVEPPSASQGSGDTATLAMSGVKRTLAAVLLVLGAGELVAAESTTPYRVLVPIDAQQKPVGRQVYVPEPLFQALYRHAAAPDSSQGWMIVRATYRGDLTADAVARRWTVDSLHAQYELHVLGHATRVRIPICSRGGSLLPDGVSLDGRSIEPQWEPETGLLAFDVAEPGVYRLEVSLRPTPRVSGRSSGFDVAVPRVPFSRLELSLPDDAPSIDSASACGAVHIEKKPARWIAELGPTDRMTVRWSDDATSSGPAVDVEQYVWLQLQPGSVVAAVKLRLRVLEGQLRQLRLSVDPRLRLLPLPGDNPPTVHTGPETGQSRLITLRLPHAVADRTALEATFLLSGATGVGNFRLPRIEALDARCTKRWMAVSVDPALDHDEPVAPRMETLTVSDFLKAWGATAEKPYAAYRLPSGEIDWNISTRPHEPRSQIDQVVRLSFDRRRVQLGLEAQVTTTSGYRFQYRLDAPVGLNVEDVSLREGDVERAGRWTQDPDGTITVFLNSAASGQQRLTLRGWLPVSPGKPLPLSLIRVRQCTLRTSVVRVFQRPGTVVSLQGAKQSGAGPTPGEIARTDLGQFVGALVDQGSKSSDATATVEPEPLRSNAKPRTTVTPLAAKPHAVKNASSHAANPREGCVYLADRTVVLRSDGGVCGTVLFDVEPDGADQCPLRLPKGYELVQVSVEGTRVSPRKLDADDWQFPLVSQHLPQRIEVVFRYKPTGAAASRCELPSPTLGDWPVRKTLWTVMGPVAWALERADNAPTVAAWRTIQVRMHHEAAMLRAAAAADEPDQSQPSCRAWLRRLRVSLAALREQQADDHNPELAAAGREAAAIEQNARQIARQLHLTWSDDAPAEESWTDGPAETLHHATSSAIYCSMAGRVDRLTLDCRPIGHGGWIHRLDTLVAWLVLAGLLVVAFASWRRKTRQARESQTP